MGTSGSTTSGSTTSGNTTSGSSSGTTSGNSSGTTSGNSSGTTTSGSTAKTTEVDGTFSFKLGTATQCGEIQKSTFLTEMGKKIKEKVSKGTVTATYKSCARRRLAEGRGLAKPVSATVDYKIKGLTKAE